MAKGKDTRPISERGKKTRFKTGEEQVAIARMGGKASQLVQKKKRLLSEICEMIGQQRAKSPLLTDLGVPITEQTKDAEVVAAMYLAASAGDSKAAAWIRDTKGESQLKVEVAPALPINMAAIGYDDTEDATAD